MSGTARRDERAGMGEPCQCLDPWHQGQPCPNTDDSVQHAWGPVKASPVLCMRCLFGCEEFNGPGEPA